MCDLCDDVFMPFGMPNSHKENMHEPKNGFCCYETCTSLLCRGILLPRLNTHRKSVYLNQIPTDKCIRFFNSTFGPFWADLGYFQPLQKLQIWYARSIYCKTTSPRHARLRLGGFTLKFEGSKISIHPHLSKLDFLFFLIKLLYCFKMVNMLWNMK